MHDEEREDQMDEYNEYFVSCKSPNGSDWFYGPFDSRSQAKSWAKGTLKAIPFEVNGLVSEHYGPPVDEE